MTRWAKDVNPQSVLGEYPRPTMVRPDWLNLNGLWDYAITPLEAEAPKKFDGSILVPFPLESALSGVMRSLGEDQILWYHRRFEIPSAWQGKRIRLHFGAADWKATVYVNGQLMGTHRGGYDTFEFDITPALRKEGQEIILAIWDPTEGDQARGKQSQKPEGIFYTPTSGLWQTVWLEPLPSTSIESLRVIPDVDHGCARIKVNLLGDLTSCQLEARAFVKGVKVATSHGVPGGEMILKPAAPRFWSPQDPFLYDLEVVLKRDGTKIDAVRGYFGMRKISVGTDVRGMPRLFLNNEFVFQWGVLDQGFWPDGIYTAPTDAALKSDIETVKAMGFNMVRKHVKVEPERWYYWCDKLGILVWQDMPSGNNGTDESKRQFEMELQSMVAGRINHPSIVMWVIFNEGWGQYDTERLVRMVKFMDSTRLVNNASGWTDQHVGDVVDTHNYTGPGTPRSDGIRAITISEFGGLGLTVKGHTWSDTTWGYVGMSNAARLTDQFARMFNGVWKLRKFQGLSGSVYTQITDVETECNGLITYDRVLIKIEMSDMREISSGLRLKQPSAFLLNSAQQEPASWRYTFQNPDKDWAKPEFDSSSWNEGLGGFGTEGTPGAYVHTRWNTSDIWLVRRFTLKETPATSPLLWMHHDEAAEVYINGIEACKTMDFTTDYEDIDIAPAALATLKAGENVIAIHCHQTTGGQYIDAGLLIK